MIPLSEQLYLLFNRYRSPNPAASPSAVLLAYTDAEVCLLTEDIGYAEFGLGHPRTYFHQTCPRAGSKFPYFDGTCTGCGTTEFNSFIRMLERTG